METAIAVKRVHSGRALLDKADGIAASIPFLMTIERKRSTISLLLQTWLRALEADRTEMATGG